MCSVATRLFISRDSRTTRRATRATYRARRRGNIATRMLSFPTRSPPRRVEDHGPPLARPWLRGHATARTTTSTPAPATTSDAVAPAEGAFGFSSRLDPGVFRRARKTFVRRDTAGPFRDASAFEGDNARRARRGSSTRSGATRALSVSARERGSVSAPGEASSLSHDARRRSTRGAPGPRRRPREARRARRRRPRTPSRAPRAWRGSRPRGGRAQERPRRVRRSRPFGPRRRRGAAQTARGTPPTSVFRGVRSGDAAGVAGQNRRDAPSRAARRHRGRSRRAGSCDALGARRASRARKAREKVLIETKMQSVFKNKRKVSRAVARGAAANLSSSSPWSARSTRKSSTSTHASSGVRHLPLRQRPLAPVAHARRLVQGLAEHAAVRSSAPPRACAGSARARTRPEVPGSRRSRQCFQCFCFSPKHRRRRVVSFHVRFIHGHVLGRSVVAVRRRA